MGLHPQGILAHRRAPAPLHLALPNAYWASHGLKGFADPYRRFRDAKRTAGCGPARPVVWGAPG